MNSSRITNAQLLFVLAFALAVGFRFVNLGNAPLSDFEARPALQALEIARDRAAALGTQPGYSLLTALVFFLFGSSEAWARFWPALAGSLLVWTPYLFRRFLGHKTAVILAFGLALDPGLVALSRLASGQMLAIGFGLLGLGMLYRRHVVWAGILAGLALLGGPAVLQGAIGLGLAYIVARLLARLEWLAIPRDEPGFTPEQVRAGVLAGGGTLILAGSLFLYFPQGLGSFAATFPAYFSGWLNPAGIPALRLLLVMPVYQPLAILFGLVAAARAWFSSEDLATGAESSPARWLSLWALLAFLLALIYPGRQVGDLAWVLVPLWALAAVEIGRYLQPGPAERVPALGQAALVVILLALAWINLAAISHTDPSDQEYGLRWAVIAGTFALGLVTTALVGLGWSPGAGLRGLMWGLTLALGTYSLANSLNISQSRAGSPVELWSPPPVTQQADLLQITLGDLAERRTGLRNSLDLLVVAPPPSLEWLLRDWRGVQFTEVLPANEAPSVIITQGTQVEPRLAAAYRGQDFDWRASPDWKSGLPPDWSTWLVFRRGPVQELPLILWARADLFPDSTQPAAQPAPAPQNPSEEQIGPGGQK